MFKTANTEQFDAIGRGDLVVEVPNGLETTRLLLCDVLYAPAVGYTLVSVGRLDILGYQVLFGEGRLVLTNPGGHQIGVVPRTECGLCHIITPKPVPLGMHNIDEVVAAIKKLTLGELHRCMGHIAPEIL